MGLNKAQTANPFFFFYKSSYQCRRIAREADPCAPVVLICRHRGFPSKGPERFIMVCNTLIDGQRRRNWFANGNARSRRPART